MNDPVLVAAEQIRSDGPSAPRRGRDAINLPMIRNWVEAMGDRNPIYVDEDAARAAGHDTIVAPPAMTQVWTMRGLAVDRDLGDPLGRMTAVLDDAGFTSVVATNCDQIYHRYLRLGEEVTTSTVLEDVVGPKMTALGEGWFYTTRHFWSVGDEVVAEMMFRILKFVPRAVDAPVVGVPSDLPPVRRAGDRGAACASTDGCADIVVGKVLPELAIYADPTFVVSTALATRDFTDVHHDRDRARRQGAEDIFVNILTDTALVQRFVTDWAGPRAVLTSITLRLGVPWYAYDTLILRGVVTSYEDGLAALTVVGENALGEHVTARVTLAFPASNQLGGISRC